MDENDLNKKPSAGEGPNESAESPVIPQPNALLPHHLLPLQYSPDLAYSAYLLGYTGSLMAATRHYFPQSVLPPYGALPLLQVPMDANQLITDPKQSESKVDPCAISPKHGLNPIPMSVISKGNDILSLFNPATAVTLMDSELPSNIAKTLSTSDMSRVMGDPFGSKRPASVTDLTQEEKIKMNRDRNREHARSTRLRKKAYVNKLKELVVRFFF